MDYRILFPNYIIISLVFFDYPHSEHLIFFMQSSLKEYPQLRGFFDFPQFNSVQLQCLPKIMKSEANMIVSAPTSSGKTVIFQMAILKYSHLNSPICLYLAPIKSLCHQKYNQWNRKFSKRLSVIEITGDSLQNNAQTFLKSHIAVGTPEKVDFLSRQSLEYLKNIRLLLIDQIHMLNFQERGATLEAIVSRIISLNSKVRIIAVSATIPNINQVGEWLRCPPSSICVFDQRYRPVPIKSVVLGFNNNGNPFNFEQTLNFKLLQVVRMYSEGKGSLIFCPTQKGTQHACDKIISQMKERQFIQNDKQLLSLVQAAKQVSNSKLQSIIPMGIAFHHASLSYQDRNTIQKLFLEFKIKILCTTSTLAMGINLPARLVVIKSTQCYKGAMKGYMEYTRIEIEQMMGRAGRPPFDTQGTVVIMTQKQNYNKYNSKLQLQNLQSQLFGHMLEHINAQISLGSISSLRDLEEYFFNSFCYIRMKKDPHNYGVKGNVDSFIKQNCLKALKTLTDLLIVNFNEDNGKVSPRLLSINISRNAVEVRSISRVFSTASTIQTSRQYLLQLCQCEQIGRYTSKIEQRKLLKKLNESNVYPLKQAISNAERKAFVLIQTELSNRNIEFWQLRRQTTQIVILLKRLNNCIKTLGLQLKSFWLYFWATKYNKFLTLKFWEQAKMSILTQLPGLRDKGKMLQSRGIESIGELKNSLDKMNIWFNLNTNIVQSLSNQLELYSQNLKIAPVKDQNGSIVLRIEAVNQFRGNYKGLTVCVGDKNNNLYYHKYVSNNCRQTAVHFPKNNSQEYKVGISKEGIVGFDEFYLLKGMKLTPYDPETQQSNFKNVNRKSLWPKISKLQLSFQNKRNNSLSIDNKRKTNRKSIKGQQETETKTKITNKKGKSRTEESLLEQSMEENIQLPVSFKGKEKQLLLPQKYRKRFAITEQDKPRQPFVEKKIKKQQFHDLKNYNWKPGFEEFSNSQASQKKVDRKKLKLVDSKQKYNHFNFMKLNDNINLKQQRQQKIVINPLKPAEVPKKQSKNKLEHQDVFNYFYNLF